MADMFNRNNVRGSASLRAAHQGIGDNLQSLAELRQEVETQRRVLMHLLFVQAQGQPLALHEDPIRTWLGLPGDATPEQAIERLTRSQAKVIGTTACPNCGAQVQDLEGVAQEQCQWCGASVDEEG
jgi:hypothetical protein